MEKKVSENATENQRKQMIKFIIQTIQCVDDRKLRNIYNLVLHIK